MSDVKNGVLAELMDIEVLVNHIKSEGYQSGPETELITPMIAELMRQKLQNAIDLLNPPS